MYKDLLTYELAEGITQEYLVQVAGKIIDSWMKNLDGFISWEITKNDKGGYTDIVSWENKESAKAAEKKMCEIPNAADWYGCYKKGSIDAVHVEGLFVG